MTTLHETRAERLDRNFLTQVEYLFGRWQESERDRTHAENSRLAVWNRADGRTYLTATTGYAVVAVDCTGYRDMLVHGALHSNVARVLEGSAHAPEAVDVVEFWDWLGFAEAHGTCPRCTGRVGKIYGAPYNLGVVRGALGVVYDFLYSDQNVNWCRLAEPPCPGADTWRASRIESSEWVIVVLSLNVTEKFGRYDPEWPRDFEITNA